MVCRAKRSAFSLIELVIVVVIMGVIAAIALPRLGSMVSNANASALKGSLAEVQRAIDIYTGEHQGLAPALESDGSVTLLPRKVIARLLVPSDADGSLSAAGAFGPYLRFWPVNPMNGSNRLRIDGAPAPANLGGWRYDSTTHSIQSDAIASSGLPSGTTSSEQVAIDRGAASLPGFSGAAAPVGPVVGGAQGTPD